MIATDSQTTWSILLSLHYKKIFCILLNVSDFVYFLMLEKGSLASITAAIK